MCSATEKTRANAGLQSRNVWENKVVAVHGPLRDYIIPLIRHRHGSLLNEFDAEDVVQETILYALQNEAKFEPARDPGEVERRKLLAWLRGIARNKAREFARRACQRLEIRRSEVGEFLFPMIAADGHSGPHEELCIAICNAIQTLPDQERRVIEADLSTSTGRAPAAELARKLEIREGTVWSRRYRAHQHLRVIVARHGSSDRFE